MANSSTPPHLEDRFLQTEGWTWGSFKNNNGQMLRFGSLYPEGNTPNAVIVLLPGRTEFIEKYFETARDLTQKNLAVWVIDWRGQGKSEDISGDTPHRGHSPDFNEHVADLNEFITDYVIKAAIRKNKKTIPLIMLAQSMGGNIGLRYLHAHPGDFKAALLCAPMLGINDIKFLPLSLAMILVKILGSLFGVHSYAFGQNNWKATERQNTDIFSHDPARNAVHDAWYLSDPTLQVGGVTFGWLYHALRSCKKISRKKALTSIKTPLLLALAGKEELVDTKAINRAAKLLPNAKTLEFPEAGHEILMEKDDIRNKLLSSLTEITQEIADKNGSALETL
ncbi:MAG: lysophospholipase [Micavibrio sp.]|nr:MAG: lysophospholipase [Micavibrio sp.]